MAGMSDCFTGRPPGPDLLQPFECTGGSLPGGIAFLNRVASRHRFGRFGPPIPSGLFTKPRHEGGPCAPFLPAARPGRTPGCRNPLFHWKPPGNGRVRPLSDRQRHDSCFDAGKGPAGGGPVAERRARGSVEPEEVSTCRAAVPPSFSPRRRARPATWRPHARRAHPRYGSPSCASSRALCSLPRPRGRPSRSTSPWRRAREAP